MSRQIECDICIVGAGAAGLWAAATAARALGESARAGRIVLLEKTARTGTKILASGGTRCNLTTTLGPDAAARLFGPRAERFLRRAFRALTPQDLRERFDDWGVPTLEAPLEKIFPASGRARDVRDALEAQVRGQGVEIEFDAAVASIAPAGAGWCAELVGGGKVSATLMLLAPGGASVPLSGTTGDGWCWLERLELPFTEPRPALVPLTSRAPWVSALSGISMQDAELRLSDASGRKLGRRRRPLLFTHAGLSGPAALDVSREVALGVDATPPRDFVAHVDLAPELEREALRDLLVELGGRAGAPKLRHALPIEIPKRLFAAVARQAGLESEDPRANQLSRAQRHALIEELKGLAVPVHGTLGMDKAEVTTGGLDLKAVNPGTMEVRGRSGLYVIGELLDVDGPVGGLNFQAAFATAELAGLALAESWASRRV